MLLYYIDMFKAPKVFINIYYDVKYGEKETAKHEKLRWDPTIKKWYSKHETHNDFEDIELDFLCKYFNIVDFKITNSINRYEDINDYSENSMTNYNKLVEYIKTIHSKKRNEWIKEIKEIFQNCTTLEKTGRATFCY